jgi:hypothetical protein
VGDVLSLLDVSFCFVVVFTHNLLKMLNPLFTHGLYINKFQEWFDHEMSHIVCHYLL